MTELKLRRVEVKEEEEERRMGGRKHTRTQGRRGSRVSDGQQAELEDFRRREQEAMVEVTNLQHELK
eukprot:749928-Hanusia_phi.AAC.1